MRSKPRTVSVVGAAPQVVARVSRRLYALTSPPLHRKGAALVLTGVLFLVCLHVVSMQQFAVVLPLTAAPTTMVNDRRATVTESAKTQNLTSAASIGRNGLGGARRGQGRWVEKLLHFYRNFTTKDGEITGAKTTLDAAYCASLRDYVWRELLYQDDLFTPEFRAALADHYALHQAVEDGNPRANQTYLVWSLSGGLGNRFQSFVSVFMTAVLSKRVLLMKDWFTPLPPNSKSNKPMIFPASYTGDYQMEALEKLFWFSNPLVRESGPRVSNKELLCPVFPMMSLTEFHQMYPSTFGMRDNQSRVPSFFAGHVKIDISARHDKNLVRWSRFACGNLSHHCCDTNGGVGGGARGRDVRDGLLFFPETFVYVWTNQYYLPLLFTNPFHAAQMQSMLPRRPYATLLRLLVLPSRRVMKRVSDFFEKQRQDFPAAPLVPGSYDALQIRAFSFKEMPDLAAAFLSCYRRQAAEGAERHPFFLATMHETIRSHFERHYTSKDMRVLSARVATDQMTGKGAEADVESLVDMFILALSRRLLISPGSTFGTFSAALGEVPTVRVNWKQRAALLLTPGGGKDLEGKYCEVLPSLEPCFASWFKYDHLLQRSNLGSGRRTGNVVPCELQPLPDGAMFC